MRMAMKGKYIDNGVWGQTMIDKNYRRFEYWVAKVLRKSLKTLR